MLGFGKVHDYVPGKADWLAHGLPLEHRSIRAARACRQRELSPAGSQY
jgi:hypothetical protein